MWIPIQLLFKGIGIYDHWSIDPHQGSILSLQASIVSVHSQGFGSGSGSGSGLDPYSIGPLDPDPDP